MAKLFDMNNPFWTFLGRLVDVFVLHILWLVCSLPIVTFGASTAALYFALMRDITDEEAHYTKAFFRSFKQNFKQGIGIGLIFLITGAMLAFAFYYYYLMEGTGTIWTAAKVITIMLMILYVIVSQWLFPFFARFDNTTGAIFQNSLLLSIRHIGWSVVMAIVFVGVYFIILYFNFMPLMILGYGLVAFINSYILNRVFEPYIKASLEAEGKSDPEKDPDAWTVELPDEENTENTERTAEEFAAEIIETAEEEIKEND